MSYIFRLHKEGNNSLIDWDKSSKYGTNVIEQIQDPNGESAKREITSIPSPFARIDLVKVAFGKVAARGADGLDGKTIHHKMVSDAFDVGQLFFEYDKFADQLEILTWDKRNDLEALQNASYPEHRQLGKTYDIFLQQDGSMYNFDQMDRIYLLNFKNGPAITNIIGATSPATLFFTSANDLRYVSSSIYFGNNDKPFDDQYAPLYKRDLEYQKYWYSLRLINKDFARLFPEVNKYLDASFMLLTPLHQQAIRDLEAKDFNAYPDLTVNGEAGNVAYILNGMVMKKKAQDTKQVEAKSGFLLTESDYRVNDKKPLVLPVGIYNKPTFYVSGVWDKNTVVPFFDHTPLGDRTLPCDGIKYPYLTISDFLTDTIVRMPYKINRESFFDGNIDLATNNNSCCYLLPLTDLFFQCFTTEQLRGELKNGKKMFEMRNIAGGGVKVTLRIPVRDDIIEYSRAYFEASEPNIANNDGAMIEKKFGLGVMPLIKFPENVKKHYRIALFDKGNPDVSLTCYSETNLIENKAHVIREPKELDDNICSIESYVINENFDRIAAQVGNIKAFIIPKFKDKSGNTEFTFAVDFGTTNSHIEYISNNNPNPASFDMPADEKQLHRLHTEYIDLDIMAAFEHNFIPDTIADEQKKGEHFYSFPMRTVLSEHKKIDYTAVLHSLADGNIPFLYEKDSFPNYNTVQTDLKWNPKIEKRIDLYLGSILILIRNKVLIKGGNLSKTKIIWFYPASMSEGKINKLNKIWKDLYKSYVGEDTGNVICMSESSAPYYYYSKRQGAKSEVVTIDVGGGTTDVYVVENKAPKMLMSFRYASNAIFGDSYNWGPDNNGFVNRYKDEFLTILETQKLTELKTAFTQIEAKKNSLDIIAFLFALADNKQVKENKSLNFLGELSKNDKLRYVFIIFYGSLLYFIAQSMKAQSMKKPLTLAFSGNGAKTLWILSDDKKTVGHFVKLIFDGVYDDTSGTIDVILEEHPKKATCKGGILEPKSQDYNQVDSIKYTPVGDTFDAALGGKTLYYSGITDEIMNNIVAQANCCIDFIFKLHEDNNDFFINKFSADEGILQKVKDTCSDQVELFESLKHGIEEKKTEMEGDRKIDETLFFYPLIGVLNKLVREINEM
jgi:hypothetical protein